MGMVIWFHKPQKICFNCGLYVKTPYFCCPLTLKLQRASPKPQGVGLLTEVSAKVR